MGDYEARRSRLRQRLDRGPILLAPGTGDALGARLIAKAGFEAVYVSGFAIEGTYGFADAGLLGMSEIADRAAQIVDVVDLPVLCDADTGYGGIVNVVRTTRAFERAGVSAIQLEDQALPKKCGSMTGKRVVETREMVNKIKAAVDARSDENMIVIGRSDAAAVEGFEAAVDRACAYGEAGADLLIITGPYKEEDVIGLPQRLTRPLLYINAETGAMPMIPSSRLQELGVPIVIYPMALILAAALAMERTLEEIRTRGTTAGLSGTSQKSWADFNEDVGIGRIRQLEAQYG